jgi:hypothetical protein
VKAGLALVALDERVAAVAFIASEFAGEDDDGRSERAEGEQRVDAKFR